MKKLTKFQVENSATVNTIDTKIQSSFKGGRFPSSSFFTPSNALVETKSKISMFTPSKSFTSFADFRAFMLTGK